MGVEIYIVSYEIGSGLGEPGGTHPPRIPRGTRPPGKKEKMRTDSHLC